MWKFKKADRVKSEIEGKVMHHGVIRQEKESQKTAFQERPLCNQSL